MRIVLACLALLTAAPALAQTDPLPAAVVADPPQDKTHPAGMIAFALPTRGGVKINAVLYTAAGAGPHPTVLLLHGLPGNEQNLDLAQAIRRDGWNVLTLHYRGAWGSPGRFTFAGCIEDAAAALTWLRDPNTVAAPGIDAGKIVVIGHSMGGFMAAYTGGHDPGLLATGLISAANLGGPTGMGALPRKAAAKVVDDNIGTTVGMHTLNATPESLGDEAIQHDKDWNFTDWAPALARHPLLIVTSNDGLAAGALALRDRAAGGAPVTYLHLETDHGYSDQRIALEAAVLRWLENLPGAPAGS